MNTIVEQTSAPVAVEERLMSEERSRWAHWEFDGAPPESWKPMADREEEEWELADKILCGSEYVQSGIEEINGPVEKSSVVPYGFRTIPETEIKPPAAHSELRVLFAGTICLRKGIPYLMKAANLINSPQILFRCVGPSRISESALSRLKEKMELPGTVARADMWKQYQWADVLVLPSISEGSANVCYEALAWGVPVVTTYNSGSVVRDCEDGFIVPIRDSQAIADRLDRLASSRKLLNEMSENALERAAEYTWDRYAERLIEAINTLVPSNESTLAKT